MNFNDITLHIMLHLNDAKKRECSVFSLHQAVKCFTADKLEPAILRGWITTRAGTKKLARENGGTMVELTDDGERWLRELCSLSDKQPVIN